MPGFLRIKRHLHLDHGVAFVTRQLVVEVLDEERQLGVDRRCLCRQEYFRFGASPELRVIARSELLLDPGCDALPWSIALPIVAGEGEPFGTALAELLQRRGLDRSDGLRRSDDGLREGLCRRALGRCFGHDQRPPANEGVSMARTMPSA